MHAFAARSRLAFGLVVAAIIAALVLLPVAFLVLASFSGGDLGSLGPWTLDNYTLALGTERYWRVVGNTLAVSLVATAIAFGLGLPLSWLTTRTDVPLRQFWTWAAPAPIYISPLVVSIAWTFLIDPDSGYLAKLSDGRIGFSPYGPLGIAIVTGLYFSTYVYLYVAPAVAAIDSNLEAAARTAGASALTMLRRVTLPLILPSAVSAGLLILVLSMGIFSIQAVLGWPVNFTMLTLQIYFTLSVPPVNYGVGMVMSVVVVAVSSILLVAYYRRLTGQRYATIRGSAAHDATFLGRGRGPALAFLGLYFFVTVVLPVLTLVVISLTDLNGRFAGLRAYEALFGSETLWTVLRNTLVIASIASSICVLIGIAVSYVLRFRVLGRGSTVIDFVVTYPIAVPGVVLSAGLMWTYLAMPWGRLVYGTLAIMVIAAVTQFSSTTVRAAVAGAGQLADEMFDAASVVGARWHRQLVSIFTPAMGAHLFDVWVLVLVLCLRELGAVLLLWNSQTETIPVYLFAAWREGTYAQVAGVGVIEMALTALLVIGLGGVRRLAFARRTRA